MFSGVIYKVDIKNVSFISFVCEVVYFFLYFIGIYVYDGRISELLGIVC